MEKILGERYLGRGQGVLILKLAQIMWFQVETPGNERGMLRYLCKMLKKGNKMLIDPIRRPIDRM